jgi:tripartite-type tricarboxylate transporter receptor subunit TctC
MRVLLTLIAALFVTSAAAETWPTRPVRLVVPAPAGSAPDFLSRLMSPKLTEIWGQSIIVENVLGAGGNIGTDKVAKAAPDGYTMLFNTIGPIAVNISLYKTLPYHPQNDFIPISLVSKTPNILAVHPSLPVNNLKELIAYAKANPGKLRYGSAGSGTSNHLSAELLKSMTGTDMLHIPYKSSAQMTTDLLGGQMELMFHNAPVILPHVKSGAIRGIAISTTKRSPAAPDLPTLDEAGVPGFEVTAWFGFMAPAKTPQAVIDKVHGDVVKVLAMPDIRERMMEQIAEPIGSTPAEYAAFIASEITKWAKVVKESGAVVE